MSYSTELLKGIQQESVIQRALPFIYKHNLSEHYLFREVE